MADDAFERAEERRRSRLIETIVRRALRAWKPPPKLTAVLPEEKTDGEEK